MTKLEHELNQLVVANRILAKEDVVDALVDLQRLELEEKELQLEAEKAPWPG